MPALPRHLKQRTRRLNGRRTKTDSTYVLCWLQQALRGVDNPIIDVAVTLANELKIPVVVYHGLDNRYPYASHRFHRFILEASKSLESDCNKRRIRFCRYIRRTEKPEPGLVYRLAQSAACIVTDDVPTFAANRQAASVSKRTTVPVIAVDAVCAVPMNLFPTKLDATKKFRAAHRPLRDAAIAVEVDAKVSVRKFTGRLCFEHDTLERHAAKRLDKLIAKCDVDMSLPPAAGFRGDRDSALKSLAYAVKHVVHRYKWTRNNPADEDSTTKLSPYLHFGVLGPREVARAVEAAEMHAAARWKFLDELLTWREYYHHLARHSAQPNSYLNVPAWARKTLAEHRSDPRPKIYSLDKLLHARTDDPTWNAAQRQFLLDGWMHNNLRMYWVKQLIKWLPAPEEAWDTACYLNDRLSLDGRDPSTYGSIQWGFGRSRRAYKESKIYGWVPKKTDAAVRKRAGVDAWIAEQNVRPMISLALGNTLSTNS